MLFSELLKSLDAFAKPVTVNFRGDSSFATMTGGTITACLYLFLMLQLLFNVNSFYNKKDPVV